MMTPKVPEHCSPDHSGITSSPHHQAAVGLTCSLLVSLNADDHISLWETLEVGARYRNPNAETLVDLLWPEAPCRQLELLWVARGR